MMVQDVAVHNQLTAELELHMLEFTKLRDEAKYWIEAERQFVSLSVIAFGAIVGFLQVFSGTESLGFLLLLPLVFHVFFREMLDCIKRSNEISSYLTEILIPRVNQILRLIGNGKSSATVLDWEYRVAKEPLNLLLFIIQPMRYWIPVFGIVALIGFYVIKVQTYNITPPIEQVLLLIINAVYLVTSIYWGIRFARSYKTRANALVNHN